MSFRFVAIDLPIALLLVAKAKHGVRDEGCAGSLPCDARCVCQDPNQAEDH
jgi:hypothetical protein